ALLAAAVKKRSDTRCQLKRTRSEFRRPRRAPMASLAASKTYGMIGARQKEIGGQSIEPTQDLTTSNYLRGALYGLSAVCIWLPSSSFRGSQSAQASHPGMSPRYASPSQAFFYRRTCSEEGWHSTASGGRDLPPS